MVDQLTQLTSCTPDTGPHALRHHYASLLVKHDESVETVSERLGHNNAAMTLNIHTHLWHDSEERTRADVDKAYLGQSADAQPQVDEAA
ncbi:tyrosine-type recombinase/integrase [Streptomyces luridiscabiei]|uniref:tyrosine-type recombinase/integrase n=1 Tax=Streptomyces luridiscabiei TaxID=164114 RepID=UPI0006E2EDE2|nr:tyrosine-type recombinase/integrase [Streptomyces luridiscabiei]